MREDILGLPDHLRDALWKIESAGLGRAESSGLAVCGMGGSAIGGDLAAAAIGGRLSGPLIVERGYRLPSWVDEGWTVLCSSYSGNTEETLSCWDEATELGARRIVATTGGELADRARPDKVPVVGLPGILQPRAAVGYMFTVAASAAELAGIAPSLRAEIEAAASALERRRDDLAERASQIAADLEGKLVVIYGASLTIGVARRWQTEINENAKLPAVSSQLPEANHNEIEGWVGGSALTGQMAAVFLAGEGQHPRERRRIELMITAIGHDATAVEVACEGDSPTERVLGAVMLGDLVSVCLAERRGVDPMPVDALEGFKRELGRP